MDVLTACRARIRRFANRVPLTKAKGHEHAKRRMARFETSQNQSAASARSVRARALADYEPYLLITHDHLQSPIQSARGYGRRCLPKLQAPSRCRHSAPKDSILPIERVLRLACRSPIPNKDRSSPFRRARAASHACREQCRTELCRGEHRRKELCRMELSHQSQDSKSM